MAGPARSRVTAADDGGVVVEIKDTGKYLLPRRIIDGRPLISSVLEIVSVAAYDDDHYTLESIRGVVASEPLAEGVRIDVYPKCGSEGLDDLLDWAGEGVLADNSTLLAKKLAPGRRLFDPFAQRLLSLVSNVVTNGIAFELLPRVVSAQQVLGDVLIPETYEDNLANGRYEVVSVRRVRETNIDANRAIVTALVAVARARSQLTSRIRKMAEDLLQSFPGVVTMASLEAIKVVNEVLYSKPLERRGNYYYGALAAALPVLYAVSRVRSGNIEVSDMPLRLDMSVIFESAIRNITRHALAGHFSVRKSDLIALYESRKQSRFVRIQPDIVVRPLCRLESCALAIDAKYKTTIDTSDHYEVLAYAQRLRSPGVVLVALQPGESPTVETYTTSAGLTVDCYRVAPAAQDFQAYSAWLRTRLGLKPSRS